MANSVIGALRVNLGLDSAQFTNGLKKAQGGLSRFGVSAGAAMAGVAAAAATAAVALGNAVKASIDHADELGKTAQKVGVSVEALSRLEYAAKLSDIGLEQLSSGLKKLSLNMSAVATGANGPVATAFAALGVSVKNADGTLRSSTAVLGDVATKFAAMEDGTQKTALAIQIFGKAGADLIPLLNAGSEGLSTMAAEADRLGVTITTKTAKSSEEFNDNLTRLGAVFEGLVNRITQEALPALVSLSNTLASPEFQNAVVTTTNLFVGLIDVLARTATLAYELANILPKAVAANEDAALYELPGYREMIAEARKMNLPGEGNYSFNEVLSFRTGAGGQGGGGVDPVVDPTRSAPTFAALSEFLNKPAAGGGGPPALARQITQVGEALEEVKPEAKSFGEELGSIFGSLGSEVAGLLKGTENLGSVLLKIAASLVGSFLPGPAGQFVSGLLGSLPGFANGTPSAPGGLAWVGERGRELVNLPRGSQVIPNSEIGEASSSLHVSVSVDDDGKIKAMVSSMGQTAAVAGSEMAVSHVKRGLSGGWSHELQQTGGIA